VRSSWVGGNRLELSLRWEAVILAER
jgi:hypothetical protein